MGWFTTTRGHYGPRYDLHRPWVLISYRAGGGRPKRVEFYESQGAAAAALRAVIHEDDSAPGDRYAYRVHYVRSQGELTSVFDQSLSERGYMQLALLQYRARAPYRQAHANRARSRHGNAKLVKTGRKPRLVHRVVVIGVGETVYADRASRRGKRAR